ncbi:LRR receptor-like serine/threonine-protein kinase RPK2 [Primulina eburnea]|uniref:LRR receptor-like serine/threonine-protein kinase RPK2 n=1 Tax=Primulina eburnea TaxID=1245227 RepID=UPI003C6BE506
MVSLGAMGRENSVFSATKGLVSCFILLCIFLSVYGQILDDKMALLEFKKSISDPNGILASWNDDSPNHCSWFGVSCDSNFRVTGLSLGGNFSFAPHCFHGFDIRRNCSQVNGKLMGKISPVIGNLTELRILSLPFNELYGEIPVEMWGLNNLEVIDLEGNFIVGNFSGFDFSVLRSLRVLNLAFNKIFGKFPPSFSECKGLMILNLARNEINGDIPGFVGCLWSLRTLNLSFNRFVGYVPSTLGYDCANLEHLDFSFNFLKGEIPRALGNCIRLKTLLLSSNVLHGVIPNELGRLQSLEVLDVSRNNLTGPLTMNLHNCVNLKVLVLSSHFNVLPSKRCPRGEASPDLSCIEWNDNNVFEGFITDDITKLPKLTIIQAPCANFKGSFPRSPSSCQSLKMVNIKGSFFTAEIFDLHYLNLHPYRLGRALVHVFVKNGISESVAKSVGNENTLFVLDLKDSNFTCQCLLNCDRVSGKIPLIHSRNLLFLETSAVDKRILCSIHQENHFYPLTSAYSSAPPPHQHKGGHRPKKHVPKAGRHLKSERNGLSPRILGAIISSAVVCVLSLVFVAVLCCCMKKNQQNSRVEISASPESRKIILFNPIGVRLTYENIVQATWNFSQSKCIGTGGFGATYRADISPGNTVAVKRLTAERHQGAPQFHAEIQTLGRIRHPNLITLIGYCSSDDEMFLIYNYLPGGNLRKFIRERANRPFDWSILHKIALNIASALSYLHDQCIPRIIHRDIKPSNILLDDEYNAYLSDFGLSKILANAETHATTRVAGTYGYISPEYALTGRVSNKADVYSYGVVLLELMSDKTVLDPSFYSHEDGFNIVSWACLLMNQGRIKDVFLETLWDSGPQDKLGEMLHLAIFCTVESLSSRPTMKQVVERLKALQSPAPG